MKLQFDPRSAFSALVGLYVGTSQGKQEFRHERRQEDDQAFRDSLLLGRLEDEQFEREAEPYRLAASAPGQTPESMQQTFKAYQEMQARRPPSASLKAAQGVFQKRYPGMPFPTGTPPMAPAAGQGAPLPQFRNPGEEEARESLLLDLRGTIRNLIDNGDEAGAQKARAVGVRLSKREITPEQAIAELGTVEQQGRVTASQDRTLETGFARLQKLHDEQRIKGEALPQAKRVLAAYASAPPSGTERRAYLQHLRDEELAGLESSDYLQMSPDDQQRMELAKSYAQSRVMNTYEGLLREIPKTKNVASARDLAGRLWARANSEEGKAAGLVVPEDLNPLPIYGGETPEEIDARIHAGLASRIEDTEANRKDRERLLTGGVRFLERLLMSGKLAEKDLTPVLGRLEQLYGEAGVDLKLPKIKIGALSEAQQEQVRQFNRRFMQQEAQQKISQGHLELARTREARERQKFALEKQSGKYAKSAAGGKLSDRDEKRLAEAQKARSTAVRLIDSINRKLFIEPTDETTKTAAEKQLKDAQATIDAIVGPLGAEAPPPPTGKPDQVQKSNYERGLAALRELNQRLPANKQLTEQQMEAQARSAYPNTAPKR